MTEFLLIVEKVSKFSKVDINQGNVPLDVNSICSCIRNVFCLSYSIRKQNTFYLYIMKDHLVVKFDGKTIKYLGPDERSQSLLFGKAIALSNKRETEKYEDWITSTPGIFIKKLSSTQNLTHFLDSLPNKDIISFFNDDNISRDFLVPELDISIQMETFLFIFTLNLNGIKNLELYHQLSEFENIMPYKLPHIKAAEDKILYINFQIDRLKEKNKIDL